MSNPSSIIKHRLRSLAFLISGTITAYVGWGNTPPFVATGCAVPDEQNRGLHLGDNFAIVYHNSCGGMYDHAEVVFVLVSLLALTLLVVGLRALSAE